MGALAVLALAGLSPVAHARTSVVPPVPAPAAAPHAGPPDFKANVEPLLKRYCVSCHGGENKKAGLALDSDRVRDEATILADVALWEDIAERLESRDMPPEEKPQPTEAERELMLAWIDRVVSKAAATARRDPGRVTIRRLNRAEYNNTVRDLLGIDLRPADDFPSDDVGYGFDNIGDVLTLPPVLLERYMIAAERIAERVIVAEVPPRRRRQRIEIETLVPTPPGSTVQSGKLRLTHRGAVRTRHTFPVGGDYRLTVTASGRAAAGEAPRVVVRIDGREVESFDVRRAGRFTVTTRIEAGPRRLEVAYVNGDEEAAAARPTRRRTLVLDAVHIDGPFLGKDWALPATHTRIIPRTPTKETRREDARAFLAPLASRAFRRPATPTEVERLARLVDDAVAAGDSFERGMQLALRAILISPHFLYRVELDDGGPALAGAASDSESARPLDDWQLASRLSYFLWSSMPDEELTRHAREGTLHTDEVLEGQVRRMLADRRSSALVENFATQWLQIRNLAGHRASKKQFPMFDEALKAAMLKESELFFEAVMREDLNVLTLIDADFTFLNERLARHYGIEGVEGDRFRKVSLQDGTRGGVLTQASVLTVTSNPTRTSPVKRGRWVLEQLLGTPPPPPPPGVPELPEKKKSEQAVSVRVRLEQHRADPSCAVCHKKMDPLGFGLENFDAVGAWRTQDEEAPVDATGVLPNGQTFSGPAQLKAVLKQKELQFRRSLATKLLTYAIGRGPESFDRPAIDEVCESMARNGNRFSSMVLAIVKSDPFMKRRTGESAP